MIAHIHGNLADKALTRIVVEVQGIGFELLIPMSTHDRLPGIGEKVYLHTYLHVREDALQLYGFFTENERALYLLLITTVTGVGPRLALNILSSMPVSGFCHAIANNDVKALSRINGIGKRSAERLVLELKDRIQEISPGATVKSDAQTPPLSAAASRAMEDAVAALITLGFKVDTARKAINQLVQQLPESELKPEKLIKSALRILNQ